jgi:hypothetical protein
MCPRESLCFAYRLRLFVALLVLRFPSAAEKGIPGAFSAPRKGNTYQGEPLCRPRLTQGSPDRGFGAGAGIEGFMGGTERHHRRAHSPLRPEPEPEPSLAGQGATPLEPVRQIARTIGGLPGIASAWGNLTRWDEDGRRRLHLRRRFHASGALISLDGVLWMETGFVSPTRFSRQQYNENEWYPHVGASIGMPGKSWAENVTLTTPLSYGTGLAASRKMGSTLVVLSRSLGRSFDAEGITKCSPADCLPVPIQLDGDGGVRFVDEGGDLLPLPSQKGIWPSRSPTRGRKVPRDKRVEGVRSPLPCT